MGMCTVHCNKNPIYVFLFWELRRLSPNFHIHVCVSDLYIPMIGPQISCSRIARSIVGILYMWNWDCAEFLFWEYLFQIFGIGSFQGGKDIVFITCILRVCAPQVCIFKLLQCSALLKHAFIYQPMCGGQLAQVCVIHLWPHTRFAPGWFKMADLLGLPASQSQPRKCRLFPSPLVTWPSPQLSPGWFKMADLRAYLHHNHSPENVVFFLILLSRDPLPGFLPADSRWRICVLTWVTITAPKMSSFS